VPTEEDQPSEESEEPNKWVLQDLRKIVLYLTQSILDRVSPSESEIAKQFIQVCVDKFGDAKVREFMEIQLMHHNEVYIRFLDWFEGKFHMVERQESEKKELKEQEAPKFSVGKLNMPPIDTQKAQTMQNNQIKE